MLFIPVYIHTCVLPRWHSGKSLPASVRDAGSIPGSGRSPAEGNGNPLQYSCLENSMDRGVWRSTVHGVAKSWTQLSLISNNSRGTLETPGPLSVVSEPLFPHGSCHPVAGLRTRQPRVHVRRQTEDLSSGC